MKVYDKSSWHIDADVAHDVVYAHFKNIFHWLNEKGFLNNDGDEIYELGSFGDTSLHDGLLTETGKLFIEKNYADVLKQVPYGDAKIIDVLNDKL